MRILPIGDPSMISCRVHVVSPCFEYVSYGIAGRRIAELEMETFITKVIENFQIDWNGAPPEITFTTINYITGPFNFVFKDL